MIGIIVSEFNESIVNGLLHGCKEALIEKGYSEESIVIYKVPGAFEIPAFAQQLVASDQRIKAIITLGAIIKGDTDHYHYISEAVSNGIMEVTLQVDIPVVFGILTCQTFKLAEERSSIEDLSSNKGYEAGKAALFMISKN